MSKYINSNLEFVAEGNSFDVDAFTEELGVQPTQICRKGEMIRNTGKRYKCTTWRYSIDYAEFTELRELLCKMVETFQPYVPVLVEWKEKYHLEYFISVVPYVGDEEEISFDLNQTFLAFASQIGLYFDIDGYVL
jgi:hypothetical protein